jgi:large subunit ribosomal protein L13
MAQRAKIPVTYITTPKDIERKWYVVDAQGQTLGRLASQISLILTGKRKPIYSPNLDCGDFVVVVNCEKIHVTGNRMDDKFYYRYSGYKGGLTTLSLRDVLQTHPDRAIQIAVKRMLPKGALGHQIIKKLKIYAGNQHPHEAQKPEVLELKYK